MSVLDSFSAVRALCIGDVMLDRFVAGEVKRISPESPVPVLTVKSVTLFAGGAANVARNVGALGGHCTMLSVVGHDGAGDELDRLLRRDPGITPELLKSDDRPTTEKTRFIAHGQHMLRADAEEAAQITDVTSTELLERLDALLADHHVLVLSDYAKGVLTPAIVEGAITRARKLGIPVVVDPKTSDYTRYNGATLVTPNAKEAREASGIEPHDDASAAAAGQRLLELTSIEAILITRAEKGMTLVRRDAEPIHIGATAREVADVVGAGDTVIATLALAIGARAPMHDAATIANAAAGVVVAKRGTATLTRAELLAELRSEGRTSSAGPDDKILSLKEAVEQARTWQRSGLKVGFTNGCFDILHIGHVGILDFSRAHCDRLIVGLNTDASVHRLKGPTRPINSEHDRMKLIAALGCVDAVVLFDEQTPKEIIELLQPDVLVKGADYTLEQIVGADTVLARGGQVLRFELVPGKSTTSTLEKAKLRA